MAGLVRTVGYLPANLMSNDDWVRHKDLGDAQALARMGGVASRRVWGLGASRPLHELAQCAAVLAGQEPPRLLIHASTTPDSTSPAAAHRLHKSLGLPTSTAACDVMSSCTSVLSALAMAPPQALIVAAEAKSRHIGEGDVRTGALFGDAAVSLQLGLGCGSDDRVWLEPYVDTSLVNNIRVENTTGSQAQLFLDNGKLMYRKTVAAFVLMIERAIEAADRHGWVLSRVFLHQANANLLAEVKRSFPGLFIPVLMADIGNTVSVSLPLHRARVLTLLALRNTVSRSGGFFNERALAQRSSRRPWLAELPKSWTLSVQADPQARHAASGLLGRYGDESFIVLDGVCGFGQLHESWLGQLSEHEWGAFFADLGAHEVLLRSNQQRPVAEAWIGAGGGFQALGFVERAAADPELVEADQWTKG